MPGPSFTGKTVVIAGAGRGPGPSIAHRFAQAGAHVVIADGDQKAGAAAAEAVKKDGLAASFEPLDVRDPARIEAVVARIVRERGAIDVWINNAGGLSTGPAETLSRGEWDDAIGMTLSGAFYCAQAAGRHMLARGRGVIVNVASVDAYQHVEGRVASGVAHAGLVALTEALGIEWAKRGVRVVGVAPGPMPEAADGAGPGGREAVAHRTPLRRPGTPEEVAEAVLFLASDEATSITAETMRVDGGWVAYNMF